MVLREQLPASRSHRRTEEAAGAPGALESHAGFSTEHTPGSHACRQVVT